MVGRGGGGYSSLVRIGHIVETVIHFSTIIASVMSVRGFTVRTNPSSVLKSRVIWYEIGVANFKNCSTQRLVLQDTLNHVIRGIPECGNFLNNEKIFIPEIFSFRI